MIGFRKDKAPNLMFNLAEDNESSGLTKTITGIMIS